MMKYTLNLDGNTFHYVNKLLLWRLEGEADGFISPELVEALASFEQAHGNYDRGE